jgi:hypothetical protein
MMYGTLYVPETLTVPAMPVKVGATFGRSERAIVFVSLPNRLLRTVFTPEAMEVSKPGAVAPPMPLLPTRATSW